MPQTTYRENVSFCLYSGSRRIRLQTRTRYCAYLLYPLLNRATYSPNSKKGPCTTVICSHTCAKDVFVSASKSRTRGSFPPDSCSRYRVSSPPGIVSAWGRQCGVLPAPPRCFKFPPLGKNFSERFPQRGVFFLNFEPTFFGSRSTALYYYLA